MPVVAVRVRGVVFGVLKLLETRIQPNYLIRNHPLPASTPSDQMQIIPVLSRVLVLPSIPGRQAELRRKKPVRTPCLPLGLGGFLLCKQSKNSFLS